MADDREHEGASVKEQLIAACRGNNVDLLGEIISRCKTDDEITYLLNNTTTVMGNHLYHEAALQGNYEVIDLLLDQPSFECDPLNRTDGDTPLHCAIRWINGEPRAQRPFGNALVSMMLEAGSSTRIHNKGRLTPYQLVDPSNTGLRDLIQKHEYAALNAGDFVDNDNVPPPPPKSKKDDDKKKKKSAPSNNTFVDAGRDGKDDDDSDDDAEFSGSDEDERAEWERRRKNKGR
ncbi:hypothetical protein AAE478_008478 [Parahypoxylon ruwenzoriense]